MICAIGACLADVALRGKSPHAWAMTRDDVNTLCAAFPGAELSDPWGGGHDAWKLCGKLFASMGTVGSGVSVKTPSVEDASLLIDLGRAVKAPYFHRSWVQVPFGDLVGQDEMCARLETSYLIIRNGLSKKLQATLPPFP